MRNLIKGEAGSVGVMAGTATCFVAAGVGFLFAFVPSANPLAKPPDLSVAAAPTKTPKVIPLGPITDKAALPAAPVAQPAKKVAAPVAEPEKKSVAPAPVPEAHVAAPVAPPAPRKKPEPASPPASAEPVAAEKPAPRPKPAAADTEAAPAPKKGGMGYLTVDAVPWADVTVDSAPVDRTPIAELPLSSGSHTVEFNNDEIDVHVVRKVNISSGGTKTLKVNLEAEAAKKAKPADDDAKAQP